MTRIGDAALEVSAAKSAAPQRAIRMIFSVVLMRSPLFEREGMQRPAASEKHKLPAVQNVRNGSISHSTDRRMPKRCAVAGADSDGVAGNIARECDSGIGCEYSCCRCPVAERMTPLDLAGLIVDGAQECFASQVVVRTGPPVLAVLRLEEIDSVCVLGADDERPRLRVEAR